MLFLELISRCYRRGGGKVVAGFIETNICQTQLLVAHLGLCEAGSVFLTQQCLDSIGDLLLGPAYLEVVAKDGRGG
jgi:hypothetical protein